MQRSEMPSVFGGVGRAVGALPALLLTLALSACLGGRGELPSDASTPTTPGVAADSPEAVDAARRDIIRELGEADFTAFMAGRPGVQYVKLVVVRGNLDTLEDDEVFFFDADLYPLHVEFVRHNLLAPGEDITKVQRETWGDEDRRYVFANLGRYAALGEGGQFVVELFEQDQASPGLIADLFEVLRPRTFVGGELAFKPNSLAQATLRGALEAAGVPVVANDALDSERLFIVQNPGRPAVGRLKVVDEEDPVAVQARIYNHDEIVVLRSIPNDISRVAGIITTEPTTPLSHVNLRARSWSIPNVMIRDVLSRIWREGFEGQWMYLAVGDDGVPLMRLATEGEIAAAERARAQRPTFRVPRADLNATELRHLRDLGARDTPRVGAKAANLGEVTRLLRGLAYADLAQALAPEGALMPGQFGMGLLRKVAPWGNRTSLGRLENMGEARRAKTLLGGITVPAGFAVPFGVYEAFLSMPENGDIRRLIRDTLADPAFRQDPGVRRVRLEAIRAAVMAGAFPEEHGEAIREAVADLGPGDIFVRSSTNSEDLVGFNGAGLYDSLGPISPKGDVTAAVRAVWASVWNQRAFEAREDYGIDHLGVYPAALIQKAVSPDVAGVLVTRDIFDPGSVGRAYINANPGSGRNVVEEGMRPEQVFVEMDTGEVRRVSLSAASRRPLLTEAHARRLAFVGALLEAHFSALTEGRPLPQDIEWVIEGGQLHLVQARPYL